MNILTDIKETLNFFELVQKHLRNVSRKFENIAHLQLEISKDNLISVRKWGNEHTDRHTRNLIFLANAETSQEYLPKI